MHLDLALSPNSLSVAQQELEPSAYETEDILEDILGNLFSQKVLYLVNKYADAVDPLGIGLLTGFYLCNLLLSRWPCA